MLVKRFEMKIRAAAIVRWLWLARELPQNGAPKIQRREPMLTLYGMQGAASLAPRMVLEEIGTAYQFVTLDGEKKEQKSADYLRLNPHGRVPTLVDGGNVIYESAAICLFVAEKAQSDLLPPIASVDRAQLYKWLMFLTNTVQPALMAYFYPDRFTTVASHAAAIKERAEQNAQAYFHQLDLALAERGPLKSRPFQFSSCALFRFRQGFCGKCGAPISWPPWS